MQKMDESLGKKLNGYITDTTILIIFKSIDEALIPTIGLDQGRSEQFQVRTIA